MMYSEMMDAYEISILSRLNLASYRGLSWGIP